MGVKTAVTTTSLTAISAAILGGGLRLLFYPQFILGMFLMLSSILIKLSRNIMGIAILSVIVLFTIVLVILFNGHILRAMKKAAPTMAKTTKKAGKRVKGAVAEGFESVPPYSYTLLGFLLPALAQFFGSLSTVRMLSSLDSKPGSLPGIGFMSVFSVVYLGTLTLGVSKTWLKPSKVSFLLQSIWVLRALFSPAGKQMEFNKFLPSVLAGWGGFFLGMTPGGAIVSALKAGAASAALAGGTVATVHGIKAGVDAYKSRGEDDPEEEEEEAQSTQTEQGPPVLDQVVQEWKSWVDEDAIKKWFQETFSKEYLQSLLPKKQKKKRKSKSENQDEDVVGGEDTTTTELLPEEEQKELQHDIDEAGFEVSNLSPPMKLAAPVVLFRALPTCFTLAIGMTLSLTSILRGQFKPGMLAIPVLLAPFALGEVLTLVRHIGFKNLLRGGIFSTQYQSQLQEKYKDGMSLLLWQSPTMLRAWNSIANINKTLTSETFMDDLKQAPAQFFSPDDATIEATPAFSMTIVGQLLMSIVIDIIGGSSYAIPALGELTDFAWAPLQGYLVHHMYGMPMLSWMGVIEEILPFTDWVPTAIIGWFYCYGQYIPAWAARVVRRQTKRKKE